MADGSGSLRVIIKQGQNFTDLAQLYYGDWTRYQEIVDANPNYAGRPPHTDGRYSSPVVAPTLFVGDAVLVPLDPKVSEPLPPPKEDSKTDMIRKSQWTGVEHQAPTPKIEIFLPSNESSTDPNYTLLPDMEAGPWSKLLNYNFSESTEDVEGSFSFAIETGEDGGKNTFDIIKIRSVIKIYEGGKKAAFVGIVRRRRISRQMTAQGAKKTFVFSGKSVASCVSEYMVSLDIKISLANIERINIDLTDQISGINKISDFIKTTWNHFNKVTLNGLRNTAVSDTIKRFMGTIDDRDNPFIKIDNNEDKIRYPIACTFYNAQNNHVADVWRNILPKEVYEIFSRCEDGKPKIIIRQKPFGSPAASYQEWKNLDIYEISPVALTGFELEQNDDNVYTAFVSYIIGSAQSRDFYIRSEGLDRVQLNEDKAKTYGFRPLQIDFLGYNRRENTNNNGSQQVNDTLQELNKLAAYWHSRNDDMYSGSVTICTDFNEPKTNPRAGCRAFFLGGEFYIDRTEHAWAYGNTPTIKLAVSRGMVYDENGKIRDGENGVIQDIGRNYSELERKAAIL